MTIVIFLLYRPNIILNIVAIVLLVFSNESNELALIPLTTPVIGTTYLL